jgi:hypothetical protein
LHRGAPPCNIERMSEGLKLNLGSGQNPLPGYVNVDKFGTPDVKCDLEQFPWPWEDGSVGEIVLNHVLEHLGETTGTFIGVMKEIYRVCRDGATVRIVVPHPRCDDFLNDPTHVRVITPELMTLFSKRLNEECRRRKAANTPLAFYHDVDFEIANVNHELTPEWSQRMQSGAATQQQIAEAMRAQNNVVRQTTITLKVVKSPTVEGQAT